MKPSVTTIIPCYNQGAYLRETIESVLAQEGVEVQVLVVDDGSTDGTAEVVRSFAPRVETIRQENAGAAAARQRGLDSARGEFIHFLDGDDQIQAGAYKAFVRAFDARPAFDAWVCRTQYMDGEGRAMAGRGAILPSGRWFPLLACHNPTSPGAVLFRRSVLSKIAGFDRDLKYAEDWDFWLQVARTGAVFGALDEAFFRYRIQSGGKSRHALGGYLAWKKILERAHGPDDRVKGPYPAYAQGRKAALLPERLTWAAATALGKAIASRDTAACAELLAILNEAQRLSPVTRDHRQSLAFHAAGLRGRQRGHAPLADREAVLFLSDFSQKVSDTESFDLWRVLLPDLFADQCGAELWEKNYRQLAGAFPVRQFLWLRRRMLGLRDPEGQAPTVTIPVDE